MRNLYLNMARITRVLTVLAVLIPTVTALAQNPGEQLYVMTNASGQETFTIAYVPADTAARIYKTNNYAVVDSVLTLPDSVVIDGRTYLITSVGTDGVYKKTTMKTLVLGANIESLDSAAINGNSALTEITWNEKCHILGSYCFRESTAMTAFTLPKPVDEIHGNPWLGCSSLTTLKVAATTYYRAMLNMLMDKKMTTLIAYPAANSSASINITTKKINDGALYGWQGTKFNLGTTVEEIGEYALARVKLDSLVIPASCKSIGQAFNYYNTSLTKIVVDTGNTVFEVVDGVLYNKETGLVCGALYTLPETVTLPEGVKEIGDYTFYYGKGLQTLNLPSTLERVGNRAFYNNTLSAANFEDTHLAYVGSMAFQATKLRSVKFPSTMRTVDYQGFYRCDSLYNLELNEGLVNARYLAFGKAPYTEIVVPSTMVNDPQGSTSSSNSFQWYSCPALKKVTVKCPVIGQGAFSLSGAITDINLEEGVEEIGDYAFNMLGFTIDQSGTGTLTAGYLNADSISFPSTLKRIGQTAFQYNLFKEVLLPPSVKYVGLNAFGYSTNATRYEVQGADSIMSRMLQTVPNMETIVFNEGLTYLGAGCYNGSGKVTEITLPSTLKKFGGRMGFRKNSTTDTILSVINSLAVVPPTLFFSNGTFLEECDPSADGATCNILTSSAGYDIVTLRVPYGSAQAYKEHEYWGRFSHIEELAPEAIYYAGGSNSWAFDRVEGEDGVYVIKDANFSESDLGFKISTNAPGGDYNGWEDFNKGALTADGIIFNGCTRTLSSGSEANNNVEVAGNWTLTIDINAMTITAQGPEGTPEVYLVGEMNDWKAATDYKFTTDDNVTFTLLCEMAAGKQFRLQNANATTINYGGVADMKIDTEEPYILVNNAEENCTLAADLVDGQITFNVTTGAVSFKSNVGIETIEFDANDNATYYNLTGIRVARPAAGIYIRVAADGAASRVYVK